jgi:hypothetical protein
MSIDMPRDTYLVWCFTPTYGPRKLVHVRAGDVVEWKRNGIRGSFKGTVLKVAKGLRVLVETHDGRSVLDPDDGVSNERAIRPRELFGAWRNGTHLTALPENDRP